MPQRPSRVIRSSEQKAARGKTRTSLRGEIDDIRSDLTKTDEEARRKQAFYDAVTFYRDVDFTTDVIISNDDGNLASFRGPFGGTPDNTIAFNAGVTFSEYVAFSTSAALDSLLDALRERSTWTPTITASSGSFTSVSATGSYMKWERLVAAYIQITVTTVGTASGQIQFTLPYAAAANWPVLAFNASSGVIGAGYVGNPSSTQGLVTRYDGASLIAANVFRLATVYEATS